MVKAVEKDEVRGEMIKSEGELIIDWIWKLCIMTLVSVVKYRRNDFCDCSII